MRAEQAARRARYSRSTLLAEHGVCGSRGLRFAEHAAGGTSCSRHRLLEEQEALGAGAREAGFADLVVCKCKDYIQMLVDQQNEFVFFQCRSGPFIPTLRMLHRFPDILPKYRVDRGAIRFVLSGANIMAPGLTSAGGKMDDVPEGKCVERSRSGIGAPTSPLTGQCDFPR